MSGTDNPMVSQLPIGLSNSVPNVLIKVNGDVNYNWQSLRPGLGATPTNFGPELNLGHDAATYFNGDEIAIIKFSQGGTTLNEDWRPPSSGGTTGWLYNNFINDVRASLAYLDSNYTVQLMGLCWMQGEYDALDNAKANNYQTNLTNFISDVRAAINAPQLPVAIGMIDNSTGWTYNAAVRQAEINVSKTVNQTSIFDTHGLGTDGTHYNTEGQLELGHYFFNALTNVYVNCKTCSNTEVKLYPNPATNFFNLSYADTPTDYNYKITDMRGAEVQSGQLYVGCVIDVSLLSTGTYFVFITNTQTTMVKKLIKL